MLKRYSIKIDKIEQNLRAIKKIIVNKVFEFTTIEHHKIFIKRKNVNEMKKNKKIKKQGANNNKLHYFLHIQIEMIFFHTFYAFTPYTIKLIHSLVGNE